MKYLVRRIGYYLNLILGLKVCTEILSFALLSITMNIL